MAIVQEIKADLLGLIGIEVDAQADPKTLARILSDINNAVQRIYTLGPENWSMFPAGLATKAPTPITGLSLTSGENTVSGTGFLPWMDGCTAVIGGDSNQNEIIQTGASTYALKNPYMSGTTASGSGIVYCDSLNLSADVISVEPPVRIPDCRDLYPLTSITQATSYGVMNNDYGRYGQSKNFSVYLADSQKQICTPDSYYIDNRVDYQGQLGIRMRLNPVPDKAYIVNFQYRKAAPRIASLDSTVAYLVPAAYNETILLPFVRFNFSGWTHFNGDKESIVEGYKTAERMLIKLSDTQPHKIQKISFVGGW